MAAEPDLEGLGALGLAVRNEVGGALEIDVVPVGQLDVGRIVDAHVVLRQHRVPGRRTALVALGGAAFGHLDPDRDEGLIGELDPESLGLIRSSVVTLDVQTAEDRQQGRLDLSHFDLLEDRPSGDFILTYPRSHQSYQSREFAELRLKLSPK